ncbi:hypothetical protein G9A89_010104 [Geosiphon pyriformis]|nr:hypothetical protein G9A89_010104 [Geosiphon pyriformis]
MLKSVIIVGAGLSGLRAAQLFHKAGFEVKILEASNRIGGRIYAEDVDHDNKIDMGAQWVGKTQTHILDLLKEFNVETYEQYNQGTKVHWRKNGIKKFSSKSSIPPLNIFALLDLQFNAISTLDKLIKDINIDSPQKSKNAAYWDSITVESWTKSKIRTTSAKELLDVAVRMIFGAEAKEISMLFFLCTIKSAGGILNLCETTNGVQEYKIKGGAYRIPLLIQRKLPPNCIYLEHPVTYVYRHETSVDVYSGDKLFTSDYIVLAIPPTAQSKITFEPSLGVPRNKLCEKFFMAAYMKVHLVYETAWWREKGYAGEAIPFDDFPNAEGQAVSPISMIYDGCNHDLSVIALTVFIVGKHAIEHTKLPLEITRARLLSLVARIFNSAEAENPTHYIEKNWLLDDWIGGAPVGICPPGTLIYYADALREPIGNVYFAGTETAHQDIGYMSGAVQAAERAFAQVLKREGVEL